MFAYFAMWFTDSFLRSDRHAERDPRRNDSHHEIDLLSIYGVTPAWTEQLRAHEGGRLKCQRIGGAEFPPYLYENGVKKPEFSEIGVVRPDQIPAERLDTLFAAGSDTTNSQVGFVLLNTLFLREHNRIAGLLAAEYPGWDDERLFQTARNIMIVLLIKIVIEEYINHITPYHFGLRGRPGAVQERALEPPELDGDRVQPALPLAWPDPVEAAHGRRRRADLAHGLQPRAGRRARRRPAVRGRLAPARRPDRRVQHRSRRCARSSSPASARRARCSSRPTTTTASWRSSRASPPSTRSPATRPSRTALRELYGHVDRIEFFPGLFAEDARPNSVLPSLIGRMVGVDAFSQALTNPLLAPRVFNEQTFSPRAWRSSPAPRGSRTSSTATSPRARASTS